MWEVRAAGELEYIMPKYCSPTPRSSPLWPSEERLRAADVHVAGMAQATMTELVTLLRNRTLLVMGDSVMEQFYNGLMCFLRKEDLGRPWGKTNAAWLEACEPWAGGMPEPKLGASKSGMASRME